METMPRFLVHISAPGAIQQFLTPKWLIFYVT
jgi:hypothetical protein